MTPPSDLAAAASSASPDLVDDAVSAAFARDDPADAAGLATLLVLPWHHSHEDIARLLQRLRSPDAIDALLSTALSPPPSHLALDDGHALARKCTWALADIGTPTAQEALRAIAQSEDPELAAYARRRLDRWHEELSRKGPRSSR